MNKTTLGREQRACLLFSLLQAKAGHSIVARLGETPLSEAAGMSVAQFRTSFRATERVGRLFGEIRDGFDPEEKVAQLTERGIRIVTLADADYPERLRESPDPPPVLYVDGELRTGSGVAIVGSRKATRSGISLAEQVGRALARRGVTVVSGLALGVDAAAHRGTLDGGGHTVGVLGCGIDVVYPRSNRALYEKMRDGGAVVSEYYLGEAPLAWRFPARNRIISGLAETLLVVEAAEKSGALITARHALDSGRDVWAAPGPVGVAECRGSNRLIADGASVMWDVEEFVDSVAPIQAGLEKVNARDDCYVEKSRAVPEGLPPGEKQVLAHVGFGATGTDEIASASGLPISELLAALAMLELKGYVGRESSGFYYRKGGAK